MNRQDIIRMVKEAGDADRIDPFTKDGDWVILTPDEIVRFANIVASAEREACAEICKKHADFYAGLEPSPIAQSAWAACVDNRDTIRARGQA